MQKGSVNNLIRIDLSDKTPDEIAEYLQIILAIRYSLYKKRLKLNIKRSSHSKVKITPA